ncbi:MAG TPA: bacteriocin fulvocin C-related protein, partial [Thermoanaerobaculia bacterium]
VVLLTLSLPLAARERASSVIPREVIRDATTLYDSLGFLPAAQRRSIYSDLDAAQRGELWAVHLKRFLSVHPELTAEQRAYVFEALGIVSTMDLRPVKDAAANTPSQRAVAHFEARAISVFTPELYREAFATLGPAAAPAGPSPWKVAPDSVDCDCQTLSDTCPIFSQGCQTYTACDWLEEGCGVFGFYWCNGLCW